MSRKLGASQFDIRHFGKRLAVQARCTGCERLCSRFVSSAQLALMRVSIDHHTIRKGLLLKKTFYEVHLTVSFTHEEKQIIRQRGLQKTKLVDRRPANAKNDDRDEKFELRVEHLMDGRTDRFLCATPSKSKIYEEDLLAMLQQMKLWLDDNAETGSRTVIEF